MKYPQGFLDELRNRVGLAEVIGASVKLIKKGREYSGLCPFHNEKTPSFTVNEQKGFYHCFGCGAHGDVISFLMEHRGMAFPDAVEELARSAGMEVPRASPAEVAREKKARTLHEVTELACAFFERALRLPEGAEARAYLARRGLDEAAIARFRIGYAPDNRQALMAEMKRLEIPLADQIEAGLVIQPEDGGRGPYDRFRGRVMFPILDKRGRVVAFGGRIMGDGKPKYLNSPETPLFHKGRLLYGLYQAREAAHHGADVIVTEGYMDVIALQLAGYDGAVAPLGTAVTEEQLGELWRITDEPVMCFDGDAAGGRAAIRAAERALPILKAGKSLRFVRLPGGEDPDSLLKMPDGSSKLRQLFDTAMPLADIVWRLETAGKPLDTPERRAAVERAVHARVAEIGDSGVRQHYEQAFKDRLWKLFRPPRARSNWKPKGQWKDEVDTGLKVKVSATSTGVWHNQVKLLAALVLCPDLRDKVEERLGLMTFPDSELDKVRRALLKQLNVTPDIDSGSLSDQLVGDGLSRDVIAQLSNSMIAQVLRINQGPDAVLEVWESTYATLKRPEVEEEWRNAGEELTQDLTDENWQRKAARGDGLAQIKDVGLSTGDLEG